MQFAKWISWKEYRIEMQIPLNHALTEDLVDAH